MAYKKFDKTLYSSEYEVNGFRSNDFFATKRKSLSRMYLKYHKLRGSMDRLKQIYKKHKENLNDTERDLEMAIYELVKKEKKLRGIPSKNFPICTADIISRMKLEPNTYRLTAGYCGGNNCPFPPEAPPPQQDNSIPCGKGACNDYFEPQPSLPQKSTSEGCGRPNCKKSNKVSLPVVCEDCGGYSMSGKTCKDEGSTSARSNSTQKHNGMIRQDATSHYGTSVQNTCCSCGRSGRRKKREKIDETNFMTTGPFASKLAATFGPGGTIDKAKQAQAPLGYKPEGPIAFGPKGGNLVVGYNKDGSPIYGPPVAGGGQAIIGYNKDGSPILGPQVALPSGVGSGAGGGAAGGGACGAAGGGGGVGGAGGKGAGTGGPAIVGYNPNGTPVFGHAALPPSKHGPGGKGGSHMTPEESAAAAAAAAKKKGAGAKKENMSPIDQLAHDIGNMYPICKYHPYCIPETGHIPSNMGWLWTVKRWYCDGKVPYHYTPGAVNKRVAQRIRHSRDMAYMRDPSKYIKKRSIN